MKSLLSQFLTGPVGPRARSQKDREHRGKILSIVQRQQQ
jgi:hypothetical protein